MHRWLAAQEGLEAVELSIHLTPKSIRKYLNFATVTPGLCLVCFSTYPWEV
jgi:hypothetical protein